MAASIGYIHKSITLSITRNAIWEVKHKDQLSCDTRLQKMSQHAGAKSSIHGTKRGLESGCELKSTFALAEFFCFIQYIHTCIHTQTHTYVYLMTVYYNISLNIERTPCVRSLHLGFAPPCYGQRRSWHLISMDSCSHLLHLTVKQTTTLLYDIFSLVFYLYLTKHFCGPLFTYFIISR